MPAAAFRDLLMLMKRSSADGKLLITMTSWPHFSGTVGINRNDRETGSLPISS